MKERVKYESREIPVSVYETDITAWKNNIDFVNFVKETGYTHVELHPVMEYLDQKSGGYSTSAYYSVTTRFGTAEDFRVLVEELHQAGIGVILDWHLHSSRVLMQDLRSLTEHRFMKCRIRLWLCIRCGEPCFIITEARW